MLKVSRSAFPLYGSHCTEYVCVYLVFRGWESRVLGAAVYVDWLEPARDCPGNTSTSIPLHICVSPVVLKSSVFWLLGRDAGVTSRWCTIYWLRLIGSVSPNPAWRKKTALPPGWHGDTVRGRNISLVRSMFLLSRRSNTGEVNPPWPRHRHEITREAKIVLNSSMQVNLVHASLEPNNKTLSSIRRRMKYNTER